MNQSTSWMNEVEMIHHVLSEKCLRGLDSQQLGRGLFGGRGESESLIRKADADVEKAGDRRSRSIFMFDPLSLSICPPTTASYQIPHPHIVVDARAVVVANTFSSNPRTYQDSGISSHLQQQAVLSDSPSVPPGTSHRVQACGASSNDCSNSPVNLASLIYRPQFAFSQPSGACVQSCQVFIWDGLAHVARLARLRG